MTPIFEIMFKECVKIKDQLERAEQTKSPLEGLKILIGGTGEQELAKLEEEVSDAQKAYDNAEGKIKAGVNWKHI